MEESIPWAKLLAGIEPHYPTGQRGVIKARAEGAEKEALKAVEKTKASVCAFVEPPFHLVKNLFRHRKGRYRAWPTS